jgi:hypothetical protein
VEATRAMRARHFADGARDEQLVPGMRGHTIPHADVAVIGRTEIVQFEQFDCTVLVPFEALKKLEGSK